MNRPSGSDARTLGIPRSGLVVLIGVSGSGKSTFAKKHFGSSQVISSDYCRALVCDDEADQSATPDAFEILHHIVQKRLERKRLTVVDATNVESRSRRPLVMLSRDHGCPSVAILLDVEDDVALEQNRQRSERQVPPAVVRRQLQDLMSSKREVSRDGFSRVYVLKGCEQVRSATIVLE